MMTEPSRPEGAGADRDSAHAFDDLLANNKIFAEHFDQQGFDGVAHAGVLMITCMDSRIVPAGDGRPELRRREDPPDAWRPGDHFGAGRLRRRRAPAAGRRG